jgi:hypothetical protein
MDSLLPLHCPTCGHDAARLYISSKSVLTVRCARSDHIWCLDLNTLPATMRIRLRDVIDADYPHNQTDGDWSARGGGSFGMAEPPPSRSVPLT